MYNTRSGGGTRPIFTAVAGILPNRKESHHSQSARVILEAQVIHHCACGQQNAPKFPIGLHCRPPICLQLVLDRLFILALERAKEHKDDRCKHRRLRCSKAPL
eukprot:6212590-Pleurochrysis_carterae.AAC.2